MVVFAYADSAACVELRRRHRPWSITIQLHGFCALLLADPTTRTEFVHLTVAGQFDDAKALIQALPLIDRAALRDPLLCNLLPSDLVLTARSGGAQLCFAGVPHEDEANLANCLLRDQDFSALLMAFATVQSSGAIDANRVLYADCAHVENQGAATQAPGIRVPDLFDCVQVSILQVERHCFPLLGNKLAHSMASCVKLSRALKLRIPERVVLLFISPEKELDLCSVLSKRHSDRFLWARLVASHLREQLGSAGVRQLDTKLCSASQSFFFLFSWSSQLHEEALRILNGILPSRINLPVTECHSSEINPRLLLQRSLHSLFAPTYHSRLRPRLSDKSTLGAALNLIASAHRLDAPLVEITSPVSHLLRRCNGEGFGTSKAWRAEKLVRVAWRQLVSSGPLSKPFLGDAIARRHRAQEEFPVPGFDEPVTVFVRTFGEPPEDEAELSEFLAGLELADVFPPRPRRLQLFHGTSAAAAHDILVNGINPEYFGRHTDFGPAFYTTDDLLYALRAATLSADDDNSVAVLCFHIDDRDPVWTGADRFDTTLDSWPQVILNNRRAIRSPEAIRERFNRADIVSGPITANAERIDTGHAPVASTIRQYAFRNTDRGLAAIEYFRPTAQLLRWRW